MYIYIYLYISICSPEHRSSKPVNNLLSVNWKKNGADTVHNMPNMPGYKFVVRFGSK